MLNIKRPCPKCQKETKINIRMIYDANLDSKGKSIEEQLNEMFLNVCDNCFENIYNLHTILYNNEDKNFSILFTNYDEFKNIQNNFPIGEIKKPDKRLRIVFDLIDLHESLVILNSNLNDEVISFIKTSIAEGIKDVQDIRFETVIKDKLIFNLFLNTEKQLSNEDIKTVEISKNEYENIKRRYIEKTKDKLKENNNNHNNEYNNNDIFKKIKIGNMIFLDLYN